MILWVLKKPGFVLYVYYNGRAVGKEVSWKVQPFLF